MAALAREGGQLAHCGKLEEMVGRGHFLMLPSQKKVHSLVRREGGMLPPAFLPSPRGDHYLALANGYSCLPKKSDVVVWGIDMC